MVSGLEYLYLHFAIVWTKNRGVMFSQFRSPHATRNAPDFEKSARNDLMHGNAAHRCSGVCGAQVQWHGCARPVHSDASCRTQCAFVLYQNLHPVVGHTAVVGVANFLLGFSERAPRLASVDI